MLRKTFAMITPAVIALAVAAACLSPNVVLAFAMTYGKPLDVNEDLEFVDVTEHMTVTNTDEGLLVVNSTDSLVVCMMGRNFRSSAKSPSPDGSVRGRRGYNDKRKSIPLNGVSGYWNFKLSTGEEKFIRAESYRFFATLQCAAVDRVLNRSCKPGMNIHQCVKQGL